MVAPAFLQAPQTQVDEWFVLEMWGEEMTDKQRAQGREFVRSIRDVAISLGSGDEDRALCSEALAAAQEGADLLEQETVSPGEWRALALRLLRLSESARLLVLQ